MRSSALPPKLRSPGAATPHHPASPPELTSVNAPPSTSVDTGLVAGRDIRVRDRIEAFYGQ